MFFSRECLSDLATGKIKGPQWALLRCCLLFLSLVYGLAVLILAACYRIKPVRLGAKTISVGNITLGGTGKTTLVEYLAAKFSSAGSKVAVLTRGYKRSYGGIGDEPAMLQGKLPGVAMIVDPNRVRGARRAIKEHAADLLIMDDGFQQWRIAKDLEIVTFDAAHPFGNQRLLPAGFLREPLSALKRAEVFFLTQVNLCPDLAGLTGRLERINPAALIVESRHEPQGLTRLRPGDGALNLSWLNQRAVAIFCGIGNPGGFKSIISAQGARVFKFFEYDDHHEYTAAELEKMLALVREHKLEALITTAKDAVKVKALPVNDPLVMVLEVGLKITKNEAEFHRRLFKLRPF